MAEAWQNRIVKHDILPAKDFLAHPMNFRIHPQLQQEALNGSLDELGWIDDVMVNIETQHVLNGHLRISLALRKGDDTPVPVKYVSLSPEEELTALAVFDELTAMAGKDREKLDALLRDVKPADASLQHMLSELAAREGLYTGNGSAVGEDVEPQVDRAAELQEQWGTALGQLWEIPSLTVPGKNHRLLCGDCTDSYNIMRLLDSTQADVCISDPVYGVTKEPWDRRFTQQDLDMMLENTSGLVAAFNAARPDIILSILSMVPIPERVGVWRYSDILPKPGMIWSWQPVFYWRASDVIGWDSLDWYQGNADKDGTHSTQKPVRFFQKIIASVECKTVYDPFLGSGTTMVAAEQLGRLCYGCDIEPKYIAVTLQRLADMGLSPQLVES